MVSYWTAYLKANYQVEYMAALLTAEAGNTDKLVEAVSECERMGIEILAPDINVSETGFTIADSDVKEKKIIRFGLGAIKNVGEAAVGAILEERAGGEFKGLSDFCTRVDQRKVNKRVLESLVKAGAFDKFGNRAALIAAIDEIRSKAAASQKKKDEGQTSLFGGVDQEVNPMKMQEKIPEIAEWPIKEKLKYEKELLGFFLSANPVKEVMRRVEDRLTHRISQLDSDYHVGQTVVLAGMISKVRQVVTKKNNQMMAFARLEDDTSVIDMVVFPNLYAESKELWEEDKSVMVTGKIDFRDESMNLVVNEVEYIDTSKAESGSKRVIKISRGTDKEVLMKISKLLKARPGVERVQVIVPNNGTPRVIDLPFGVAYDEELDREIKQLLQ
jgi:DNA polymerase-3 subunit alpha